jgi:hypothetical protein
MFTLVRLLLHMWCIYLFCTHTNTHTHTHTHKHTLHTHTHTHTHYTHTHTHTHQVYAVVRLLQAAVLGPDSSVTASVEGDAFYYADLILKSALYALYFFYLSVYAFYYAAYTHSQKYSIQ